MQLVDQERVVDLVKCLRKFHDKNVSLFPTGHVVDKLVCKSKELRLAGSLSPKSVLLVTEDAM